MKLQRKLLIAFTVIILLMALFQTVFIQHRVESIFGRYLDENLADSIESLKGQIVDYYTETGTLEGIDRVLFPQNGPMKHGRGTMQGMNMAGRATEIYVADANHQVVASSSSLTIGESIEGINGSRETISVNGEKIGEIIVQKRNMGFFGLEEQFIRSSNFAVIVSSLLAVLTAVFISIILSKKMVKPLGQLMDSIDKMNRGERNIRVHIDSKDEFSELGAAFNELLEKLNKNEQVRKNLVADVAHELRSPLAILQGRLESIQEGAGKADEKTILQLSDEVYRLNRLVDDLQQLSLAEAGELPLHKKWTDMNELIERVCMNFQGLVEEKGISLEYNKTPTPISAFVDPDRLTQIMVNVVGNALKWTPPSGRIEVSVKGEKEFVKIAVSDTGPGIKREHLEFIFDRFYKTDKARRREDGGTGLGLSIAKGFAEAHGGTIRVESEEGKGTTFTILIPMGKGRDKIEQHHS